MDEVKLSRIDDVLAHAEYPLSPEAAADRFAGVTVLLADGQVDLGELVGDAGVDAFDSVDDLATEINNLLPVGAVGEPGQSEGEG
jgi:hypothetical protein